jgi:hypothetical protein
LLEGKKKVLIGALILKLEEKSIGDRLSLER